MYELKQGAERLITALYSRKEDPAAIQRVAAATNYLPQQFKEDIQALYDFYLQAEENEE